LLLFRLWNFEILKFAATDSNLNRAAPT